MSDLQPDDASEIGGNRRMPVTLDIVIPAFNEEAVLPRLFETIESTFTESVRAEIGISDVHCIFVDDGSSDRTAEIVYDRIQRGLSGTLVRFSRNFGHQAAVCAGLAESRADVTVVMDADLQDPPELIPQMVRLWRDGNDVIYGQRTNRKENPLKVFAYWAFYRLLKMLSEVKVPLDSGDFCLMDAAVVRAINRMPEVLRFPRGLRSWVGFRQTALAYDRPKRSLGTTKYSLNKLYALATDGIAAISLRPLKFSQLASLMMIVVSIVSLVVLLARLFFRAHSGADFTLILILFCVLATSSVQLLSIHILGAYVGRTYLEVKHRPPYVVRQRISNR